MRNKLLINHPTQRKTVPTVVAVLPIHRTTFEVEAATVKKIAAEERTAPIVTVTTNAHHTPIAGTTSSRKEQDFG